jgi:mannan endo-1,4-beta-mannosidase
MFKKKVLGFILIFSSLFLVIGLQQNVFASVADLQIGAWPGTQPTVSSISSMQNLQQRKLDVVQTFINWSTYFSSIKPNADAVYANESIFMVTWESWEYNTVQIKDGKADSYIKQMANDMKAYNKEIWLRPLHEGNGNWYPWCIGDSTVNTNATYIAAWRHIVDIFRAQGATNIKFVFNINCSNVGTGASFTDHYPGDSYIDYNSLDGYNWGTTQSWGSTWQTFDQIFSASYNALKRYDKPIMITEVASAEQGGDKAQWITDTFKTIDYSYDRLTAFMWFNEQKETAWVINSSTAALEAYVKAIGGGSASVVGDLTNDGSIDSLDFAVLKKYLLGLSPEITPDMNTWDLNGDNGIDAIDFALLKKYLLGQIIVFTK